MGLTILIALMTLGLSRCDDGFESLLLTSSDYIVIDSAMRWHSPSQDFSAPETPEGVEQAIAKQQPSPVAVTFPYQQQAASYPAALMATQMAAQAEARAAEDVVVQWFYVDLLADRLADISAVSADNSAQAPAAVRQVQLYIPRIYVTGSVAVYLNNQRLWQTQDSHFYNGFYRPLELPLSIHTDTAAPRLWIRTASYARAGQTLSRLWLGSPKALALAYSLRQFLQTGVVRWTQYSYWFTSFWMFILWLLYRRYHRERFHLWFILMAATLPLTLYSYLPKSQTISQALGWSDAAVFWMMFSATFLLNHALIQFVGRFVGVDNRLLVRVSSGVTVVALAVCWAMFFDHQPLTVSLLHRAVFWLIIPFLLYVGTLLVIFSKKPNRVSAAFLVSGGLMVLAGGHDMRLHLHQGAAESLLWMTYTYPFALLVTIVFVLNKYIQALRAKENANRELQIALRKKEQALSKAYKKLLQIEAEQTLTQERHRLMQEMHDGVGSSLVYAMHSIQHRHSEQANQPIDDAVVVDILQTCMEDLKIAIDSLEPVDGDLTLLLGSLRYRLEARFKSSDIDVRWQVKNLPPLGWLDATGNIHILRILQEVLSNVFKYSHARQLTLSTRVATHDAIASVAIIVEDDGIPFHCPPESALRPENKGIHNILQRCRQLQGHCRWQPLDKGNRFSLWLPLNRHINRHS